MTRPLKEVAPVIAPAITAEDADRTPKDAEVEYKLVEVELVRVEFVEDKFDVKKLVEVALANVAEVEYRLVRVAPLAERLVVEAFVKVAFVEKRDASVAPTAERLVVLAFVAVNPVTKAFVEKKPLAERLVVDAFRIVAVPVVLVFVKVAPVALKFVVDAFVIVAFVEKRLVSVAPTAERFVVDAFPSVVNPVTFKVPFEVKEDVAVILPPVKLLIVPVTAFNIEVNKLVDVAFVNNTLELERVGAYSIPDTERLVEDALVSVVCPKTFKVELKLPEVPNISFVVRVPVALTWNMF